MKPAGEIPAGEERNDMGKVETYTQNRVEGLAWALDLIMREETVENEYESDR